MVKENNKLNLYEYLYGSSTDPYLIELLQYEINKRIYYYGNHYVNSWETTETKTSRVRTVLIDLYKKYNMKSFDNSVNLVLSNSYFSINEELQNQNLRVIIPWWNLKKTGFYLKDKNFIKLFNEISITLKRGSINEIISQKFQDKINIFIRLTKNLIRSNNFKAGFFANDLGFFERIFIDIFKEQNIPTFIFLHGLPGRYNSIDDNRADYLVVWGEKIKENYISAGVSPEKIIVSGHPSYNQIKKDKLKFSLENILVISKPNNGTPAISDNILLSDRGNSLLYLELLKSTLLSLNIKQVKLRLHPSENKQWYLKNIDTFFYSLDEDSLPSSLKKASLVIGPTSTVILDAIYIGVNYLIFEPSVNGYSLMNYPIVPPFNGDERKIPVAKNKKELSYLIENTITIDNSVFNEYIAPKFDFSEVYKKIGL